MLIVEANFPFLEEVRFKKRPALALTQPVGKYKIVICAFITSKIPKEILNTDILIDSEGCEFEKTGLLNTSIIRLHKIASLQANKYISGKIGKISSKQEKEVKQKLAKFFSL